MALSKEEKEYVIETLDKMDRQKVDRILSSTKSFFNWLSDAFTWLFKKIAEWELHRFFDKIVDFFS